MQYRQELRQIEDLIERGRMDEARAAVHDVTHGKDLAETLLRDRRHGRPLAVLPDLSFEIPAVIDSLPLQRPRISQAMFKPQVVLNRFRRSKLESKHPDVTIEQFRALQRALDRGELVYEDSSGGRRKLSAIIVHAPHDGEVIWSIEQWWRYVIKINARQRKLSLVSIYPIKEPGRVQRNRKPIATMMREWDRERWVSRG